jgi:outer membrane biosynthesis protein TonB
MNRIAVLAALAAGGVLLAGCGQHTPARTAEPAPAPAPAPAPVTPAPVTPAPQTTIAAPVRPVETPRTSPRPVTPPPAPVHATARTAAPAPVVVVVTQPPAPAPTSAPAAVTTPTPTAAPTTTTAPAPAVTPEEPPAGQQLPTERIGRQIEGPDGQVCTVTAVDPDGLLPDTLDCATPQPQADPAGAVN